MRVFPTNTSSGFRSIHWYGLPPVRRYESHPDRTSRFEFDRTEPTYYSEYMTTLQNHDPKEIPPCAKHTNPPPHPPPALRMTTPSHVIPAASHVHLQVTCAQGTTLNPVTPAPTHVRLQVTCAQGTTPTHITPAASHVRLQATCAQGTTLNPVTPAHPHVIPAPNHVIPAKAGIHPAASKPPKSRPFSRRLQNSTRTDRTLQDSTETRARTHAHARERQPAFRSPSLDIGLRPDRNGFDVSLGAAVSYASCQYIERSRLGHALGSF